MSEMKTNTKLKVFEKILYVVFSIDLLCVIALPLFPIRIILSPIGFDMPEVFSLVGAFLISRVWFTALLLLTSLSIVLGGRYYLIRKKYTLPKQTEKLISRIISIIIAFILSYVVSFLLSIVALAYL